MLQKNRRQTAGARWSRQLQFTDLQIVKGGLPRLVPTARMLGATRVYICGKQYRSFNSSAQAEMVSWKLKAEVTVRVVGTQAGVNTLPN